MVEPSYLTKLSKIQAR